MSWGSRQGDTVVEQVEQLFNESFGQTLGACRATRRVNALVNNRFVQRVHATRKTKVGNVAQGAPLPGKKSKLHGGAGLV